MLDKYGRKIDYVRISLTDRCNLRCVYCMPEEGVASITHEQILRYDEILRVCRILASLGIRKIKLTGGEPLVRKNCVALIRELKQIPGVEQVTLTTNGVLLKEQLPELAEAGLDAINLSLDTLDADRFTQITRREELHRVLEALHAVLDETQIPLKLNCVPVVEDSQNFIELAGLAKNYPIHVRFIEMMPIGYGKEFRFRSEDSIREILENAYGPMEPIAERYGNGPCHYYKIDGFQGKIGFISAMTHKFCHECNRVRMTAEGYLKACLQYQTGADLRELLRNGSSDEELTRTIREVIWNKPVSHHFQEEKIAPAENRMMSQIGG